MGAQVKMLTEAWEYTSADRFLHCLPLHHVHGLFNALLAPIYADAAVDFMPKFSMRGVWQRWCESYPTPGSEFENAITVFTTSAANQLRLMMCGLFVFPYPVMKQWESITGHQLLERLNATRKS